MLAIVQTGGNPPAVSISYVGGVRFGPNSRIPSQESLDSAVLSAFSEPGVKTYILMLHMQQNKFSTVEEVIYEVTPQSEATTTNAGIVAGAVIGAVAFGFVVGTLIYVGRSRQSSGRYLPASVKVPVDETDREDEEDMGSLGSGSDGTSSVEAPTVISVVGKAKDRVYLDDSEDMEIEFRRSRSRRDHDPLFQNPFDDTDDEGSR